MRKISSLVFNLSDFPISKNMENLLNHGLSFVPIPDKLNITQVKTDLNKYERSMLWQEFWFENEPEQSNEEDTEYTKNVFKSNRMNFPKTGTSNQLKMYLHFVHSDIVGSCKKRHETRMKYNLLPEEFTAIKLLKDAQSKGEITIKECDKGGEICIMNTDDYIDEINSQLNANFKKQSKKESNFYVQVTTNTLDKRKKAISNLLHSGASTSIISKSDIQVMEPNGKPGRLYGIPKIHKNIQEGKRLPPLRPHSCLE